MAKKDKKTQPDEITKDDVRLDTLYQDLYKRVMNNTYEADLDSNKTQIYDIMSKIDDVLNGDLDEMIDNLIATDRAEKLKGSKFIIDVLPKAITLFNDNEFVEEIMR